MRITPLLYFDRAHGRTRSRAVLLTSEFHHTFVIIPVYEADGFKQRLTYLATGNEPGFGLPILLVIYCQVMTFVAPLEPTYVVKQ